MLSSSFSSLDFYLRLPILHFIFVLIPSLCLCHRFTRSNSERLLRSRRLRCDRFTRRFLVVVVRFVFGRRVVNGAARGCGSRLGCPSKRGSGNRRCKSADGL